jgi:hypothetical protein
MRAKWFVIAGAVVVLGLGAGWWLVNVASEGPDAPGGQASASASGAGEPSPETKPVDKKAGVLQGMDKHWFEDLTAEKAGMTPEAFEAAKASSGKLGVPTGTPDKMEIAGFEFVKLSSGGTEGTMIERMSRLFAEAAAQSIPTQAPPISWMDARDIGGEKFDDSKQEILLPVPPGTAVRPPLVSGRRATSKVRCGGSMRYGDDMKLVILELLRQVRAANGEPRGMYVRLSRIAEWFKELKEPGAMTYQVCIAFD